MSAKDRLASIALLVVTLLVLTTGAVVALPGLQDGAGGGNQGNDSDYSYVVADGVPGEEGEYVPVNNGGPPPVDTTFYPVLDTDPVTGAACTRNEYILVYDAAQLTLAASDARARTDAYYAQIGDPPPPPCSGVTVDPGAPARRAAEIVAGELEPADPYVQPDYRAITGIYSYLQTNIDSSFSRPVTVTLFGRDWDVAVDVEGVHTVDWGDGTVEGGFTGNGGEWHEGDPNPGAGDIAHGYLHVGDYPLTVATDWTITATLTATGTSVTQTAQTTSDPVTMDVDEVRSKILESG